MILIYIEYVPLCQIACYYLNFVDRCCAKVQTTKTLENDEYEYNVDSQTTCEIHY